MFLSSFPSFSLKKIVLFLFIFLIGFSVVTPAFADDTNPAEIMLKEYCTRRDSPVVNLEQWYGGKCHGTPKEQIGFSNIILLDIYQKFAGSPDDTALMNSVIEKIQGLMGGKTSLKEAENYLASTDSTNNSSVLSVMANVTGKFFSFQPASSMDYIAYVRNNISRKSLVTPAYAAGSNGYGFNSLQALLPIWQTFRNITYFLFTLVFVFYGFAIMFRTKMGSQTAISIQTALPRIIITLLAITFSYAIAGLLIDLSYVVTGFIFAVLSTGPNAVIQFMSNATFVSGQNVGLWGPFIAMIVHIFSFGLTAKLLAVFLPPLLATIISVPANLVIGLILLIAILFTFAKIIWMLLKASVSISLQIMFAPLILLGSVFSATNAIGNWVKSLIADLGVFVATMIAFLFTFYFIGPVTLAGINPGNIGSLAGLFEVGRLDTSKNFWVGPPLFGQGMDSAGKFALIGLGIFFMIPKLDSMIHDALKSPAFKYGSELGDSLKPASRQAAGLSSTKLYKDRLPFGDVADKTTRYLGRLAGWKP